MASVPSPPPPADPGPAPVAASADTMLLRVWLEPSGVWHARLVTSLAQVHDFNSPFALARFLCRPLRPAAGGVAREDREPGRAGLR